MDKLIKKDKKKMGKMMDTLVKKDKPRDKKIEKCDKEMNKKKKWGFNEKVYALRITDHIYRM